MSTVRDARWEVLLHAVVELSTLARGEFGDLSVARRILVALERLFPGCRPRLGLVEGDQLLGFALPEALGSGKAMPLGQTGCTPLVREWLRQLVTAADTPLPTPAILTAHQFGEGPLRFAALVGAHHPVGYAAIHSDEPWDEDQGRALQLLAAQAGTILENARLYRRLEREAQTDGLTGVGNYRHFMEALDREMERVKRRGGSLAVLMVDVDNLKEYNDQFGHLGGSAALKELAGLLAEESRSIDVVAKYGGDEFSLLLPDCGWEGAELYAKRALARVRDHRFEGEERRRLTISVGISVHPDEGGDAKEILRRADERLFRAKESGRNRIGTR